MTDNQGAQTTSAPFTVTVTGGGGGTVVEKARGKPATASTSENADYAPAFGNDGTVDTRWSSNFIDNQWWQVDLGSNQAVTSVVVTFNIWAWPRTYTVAVSTDGNTWTTVANETLTTWGTRTSAFAATTARYVRITGVTRGTSAGTSIEEAQVFGPS